MEKFLFLVGLFFRFIATANTEDYDLEKFTFEINENEISFVMSYSGITVRSASGQRSTKLILRESSLCVTEGKPFDANWLQSYNPKQTLVHHNSKIGVTSLMNSPNADKIVYFLTLKQYLVISSLELKKPKRKPKIELQDLNGIKHLNLVETAERRASGMYTGNNVLLLPDEYYVHVMLLVSNKGDAVITLGGFIGNTAADVQIIVNLNYFEVVQRRNQLIETGQAIFVKQDVLINIFLAGTDVFILNKDNDYDVKKISWSFLGNSLKFARSITFAEFQNSLKKEDTPPSNARSDQRKEKTTPSTVESQLPTTQKNEKN